MPRTRRKLKHGWRGGKKTTQKKTAAMRKRARSKPEVKAAIRAQQREYRSLNAGAERAKTQMYRLRKERATPPWLSEEQKKAIVAVYELARDCRAVSGQDYHVDHVVPIKGKGVCGLHVPWNLQVLPQDVNDAKGAKFEGGWQ